EVGRTEQQRAEGGWGAEREELEQVVGLAERHAALATRIERELRARVEEPRREPDQEHAVERAPRRVKNERYTDEAENDTHDTRRPDRRPPEHPGEKRGEQRSGIVEQHDGLQGALGV